MYPIALNGSKIPIFDWFEEAECAANWAIAQGPEKLGFLRHGERGRNWDCQWSFKKKNRRKLLRV